MDSERDDSPAAPATISYATPYDIRPSGHALRRAMFFATFGWMFGSVWLTVTSGAPLTLYAQALGASKFQFGLLAALPFIASFISLPASLVIERTGRRKKIFLYALYGQRIVWMLIAILPFWMVKSLGVAVAPAALSIFLILILVMHSGQAIGGPAWVSWMADVIPERVRGTYFSRRRQWGILPAIPAALVVGFILDRIHAPGAPMNVVLIVGVCSGIFLFGAFIGLLDILAFHLYVPDIPTRPKRTIPLRKMLSAPLRDKHFLWFAGFVGTLMFSISFMGHFITLYLIEKMQVTNMMTQLMLLVAPALAQLVVLGHWGKAADRMGKKPVLILASLGLVPVGFGWCFMTTDAIWLGFILSALGTALWSGVDVANLNLMMEFGGSPDTDAGESGSSKGTSYVAVNSIIINLAGAAGGLTSGLIAQSMRDWTWTPIVGLKTFTFYEILFGLSGVLRLLAVVVFLPHIHETGSRPTFEVFRYMTSNFYNNLYNGVMQPARLLAKARVRLTRTDRAPVPDLDAEIR